MQMIDLVLKAAREKLISNDLDFFASLIERANCDRG